MEWAISLCNILVLLCDGEMPLYRLSLGQLRLSETILSSLAALERTDRQSQTSWPLGILL